MLTDPNALAAKAWEDAERAGEDAYIEAVQTGVASSDIAMAKGAVAAQAAIAAVYAPRLAELEAEVERLRDGLAEAIAAISDPRGLDDAICCSGHMCGCRGSSHRELLLHDLSEVLARTALGASHDADA